LKAWLSTWGFGGALRRLSGVRLGRLHQYSPRPLSIATIKADGGDFDLPCISLVTPSFNQAKFIGETIRSVLQQGYPSLEYVVQDACSTDGTADILSAFIQEGVDIRIEPDRGQADALNLGFSGTLGDVMGYLNSDDLLLPGTLHFVGRYFRDNPAVDVIYGNRLIIDEGGFEIGRWILPGHDAQVLRRVDYVPQESMFWRRSIWARVGGHFDTQLHYALDWDIILRFIDAGAEFRYVPELFGLFRVHRKQKSQADFVARGTKEIRVLQRRYSVTGLNSLDGAVRHGRYLYLHRRADAIFAAKLSG